MPRRSLLLLLLTALPLTAVAQPSPTAEPYVAAALAAPAQSNPPDGARLPGIGPAALTWETPDGSTQQHLQVVPASGDGPSINLIRNADGRFTIPAPPAWYVLLPDMTYTWRIRVTDKPSFAPESDPAWGPWSAGRTFRTPPASSATLTALSPSDGGTVAASTPALTWSDSAADVFYYEIQVSGDDRFDANPETATSFVYWNLVHGGVSAPPKSWRTPPLAPGLRYFWRVRPRVQGDGTPVVWGPVWSFITAAVLDAAPATPTPAATAAPSATATPGATATATPDPNATPTPAATPTLAPNRIAFTSSRDGNFELYAMNPDGSRVVRITNDPAADTRAVWSPDGKRIAWGTLRHANTQVYMANADGSKPVRFAPDDTSQYHVSFSADGAWVAFVSNGRINVTDANGGGRRALADTLNNSLFPLFSPAASALAFARGQGSTTQVCMIQVSGQGLYCFTPGAAASGYHSWSPDGAKILFASNLDGRGRQIYVVSAVPGAALERLTNNPFNDTFPAWSPDGKQIAFVSDRDNDQEIYVMNADGSDQRRLTRSPGSDYNPVWSPDGKQIAFVSERDGDRDIYVMNANGAEQTDLTPNNALDDLPVWSPK